MAAAHDRGGHRMTSAQNLERVIADRVKTMLSSVVGLLPLAPRERGQVGIGILQAEAEAAEVALIGAPPQADIGLVFRLDIG